jgi:hypothetical protein
MVISLKNIASQNDISLPDLLTRPVGRAMFAFAEKKLQKISNGETVVCDFDGVEVIDPSFVDEFVIRLLKIDTLDDKTFFVRVKNISKSAELNIKSVLDSYLTYGSQRYALLSEELTSNNSHVIGELNSIEHDIIELIRINSHVTLKSVIELLNINEETGNRALSELCRLGLVKNLDNSYMLV